MVQLELEKINQRLEESKYFMKYNAKCKIWVVSTATKLFLWALNVPEISGENIIAPGLSQHTPKHHCSAGVDCGYHHLAHLKALWKPETSPRHVFSSAWCFLSTLRHHKGRRMGKQKMPYRPLLPRSLFYQELSLMTEREVVDPYFFIQILCGLDVQLLLHLKKRWLKQELQLYVLGWD